MIRHYTLCPLMSLPTVSASSVCAGIIMSGLMGPYAGGGHPETETAGRGGVRMRSSLPPAEYSCHSFPGRCGRAE